MTRTAAILGLGPVGLATAWSLLGRGMTVHGFDRDRALTDEISAGRFPRAESLTADLRAHLRQGFHLHPTVEELPPAELTVIAVGTPAGDQGFELGGLLGALESLPPGRHLVLRSTLEPGTLERKILPFLRERGPFELSYYPEFLREKFLREDTLSPPLSVAAHTSPAAARRFAEFFPGVSGRLDFNSLEALKIACNAFHALKVVFANEVADLCRETGADGERVMGELAGDTKLNLSPLYLRPGAPFGGPCLDKDLRALEHSLDRHGLASPLLRSVRKSNDARAGGNAG